MNTHPRDRAAEQPALAQINTLDASGRIVSHTTSSENYPVGCGAVAFGKGTIRRLPMR